MKEILESGKDVCLLVEGKSTYLKVWISKENIYFRLEKVEQYSVPLEDYTLTYLEKPNEILSEINRKFGFNRAKLSDLNEILDLIKDMKIINPKIW